MQPVPLVSLLLAARLGASDEEAGCVDDQQWPPQLEVPGPVQQRTFQAAGSAAHEASRAALPQALPEGSVPGPVILQRPTLIETLVENPPDEERPGSARPARAEVAAAPVAAPAPQPSSQTAPEAAGDGNDSSASAAALPVLLQSLATGTRVGLQRAVDYASEPGNGIRLTALLAVLLLLLLYLVYLLVPALTAFAPWSPRQELLCPPLEVPPPGHTGRGTTVSLPSRKDVAPRTVPSRKDLTLQPRPSSALATAVPSSEKPSCTRSAPPVTGSAGRSENGSGGAPDKGPGANALLLCLELVVPEGNECNLILPWILDDSGGASGSITVDDANGIPVFHVYFHLSSPGASSEGRLVLRSAVDGIAFAFCNDAEPEPGALGLSIFRAEGAPFGVLRRDAGPGYSLRTGNGGMALIHGDSRKGIMKVTGENDCLIAVTGATSRQRRRVRIGPQVDAGLVTLAILGIDLLELDAARAASGAVLGQCLGGALALAGLNGHLY